jgi:acyl transferase domain-containing protein/NADPH:quinone reductase-like Zn-dependent oxidoreductase
MDPLPLQGSIKTNIGHLEAASGVASVIKAVMVLKNNQIPPHLNFINPKPNLNLKERGIKVPLELQSLAPEGYTGPKRVSVNSFGYGGANSHAILEAYDPKLAKNDDMVNGSHSYSNRHTNGLANGSANNHTNGLTNGHTDGLVNGDVNGHTNGVSDRARHPNPNGITNGYMRGLTNGHSNSLSNGGSEDARKTLVVLSANSEKSLKDIISNLRGWLSSERNQTTSFTDLVYTLNVRRSKLTWRCSVLASTLKELEIALGDSKLKPVKSAKGVGMAFVFTGQGAQWFGMGRELLIRSGVFASSIATCNQAMKDVGCDWDLVEELSRDKDTTQLGDSKFSQPCTTAIQIALVDLLESYGIQPDTVFGHSSGEIAAAYAAGALSKDAAMQASYSRGIWSSKAKALNATPGTMLAVGEGEEAIQERIGEIPSSKGKVTVACVNSPQSTTVSGDVAAIEALQEILEAASVFNRRLQVDSAYHSHQMEVVSESYLSSLERMPHVMARKKVAFYSSVTGTRKLTDFGPSYWVANLVSQVKFSAASRLAAEHLGSANNNVLIEVGPHAALAGPLRQCLSDFKVPGGSFRYNYVSCLVRKENAVDTMLALAGKTFEAGCAVRLDAVMYEHIKSGTKHQLITTLPTYAWDTSVHWHESRLSKSHRLRPFPNHDLLGLFDVNSSLNEPRWRYHVSLQIIPWLRDHVVEDLVIFPGAGYLAMVTEAMKQLFQMRKSPGHITGITFRDVSFMNAVVVPGDSAEGDREVELQLTLSPARQYAGSTWEFFRILSYDAANDTWVEHCSGLTNITSGKIAASSESSASEIDGLGHMTKDAAADFLTDIKTNSADHVDHRQLYKDLATAGNIYGPSFQGLVDIHAGKCCGIATIIVEDVAQTMPGHYMQPHTIHPTALDAMIQLVAVVFRRECSIAPIMPVLMSNITIASDIDMTPGVEIVVALRMYPESRRSASADFCAYQKAADGTYRPVLAAQAIRPQVVGEIQLSNSEKRRSNYRLEVKPDVDFFTQTHFLNHTARQELFDVGHGTLSKLVAEEQLRLNDQVASIFIRRAVNRMREANLATACNPHLSKLLTWMQEFSQFNVESGLAMVSPGDEEDLVKLGSNDNIIGFTLSRLGPQLFDIFTGNSDPVELLIGENLLGRIYTEATLFNCHYAQAAEYLQLLVHKNPKMKILDIGASTGNVTMPLLKSIERNGQLLVQNYTYSDATTGQFERARNTFSDWSAQMDFKTLDISRDPLDQGYSAHSFDLIVASIVLHATPDIESAVANVRKLLSPGGRLILIELTQLAAAHNMIFGTLASWWMSADERQNGPLLSVSEWEDVLKRNGFSGADIKIPAHLGASSAASSLIIARVSFDANSNEKLQSSGSQAEMKASFRLGNSDTSSVALQNVIRATLDYQGVHCSNEEWSIDSTVSDPSRLVIVLDSAEKPLLLDPTQETFEQTKQLMLQGRNILWVSFQYSPQSVELGAMKNMINGMARVIRRENPGLRIVTVDVQDPITLPQGSMGRDELHQLASTLDRITLSSFWPVSQGTRNEELEYTVSGGILAIPRLLPDERFARYIESQNQDQDRGSTSLVDCKYLDKDRPLVFDVQVPGLLNTIRFVDNNAMAAEPLGPDQIEVQAYAHGVNFKDIFIALGQMQPGTLMTGEAAGVITAVGSNIGTTWKIGDRVLGLLVAPFGNVVRMTSAGTVSVPDSLTFADAASLPIVYYTAWYCLTYVARLKKGQTVLIHAASGGVGQAAIQIAQYIGAEIYATVGSPPKRKLIQDQYGIPDDHIFSSHSKQFKNDILRSTGGKGVDVVLNSLSGELLMESWDCVAPFGTFCEIGKTDIFGRSQLNMANFEKQATFAAVDTSHMYRLKTEFMTRGLREIFDMVDRGILKPVYPVTTYPISQIEDAFRLIAARKHTGKLVLVADEQTVVQAPRPKGPPLRLHREGTYVIAGGLGDLGKRIGRYLIEHGAGHIVALSRRKVDPEQRANLEESFSKLGGTLHIAQCDICNEDSALAAAKAIAALPPVRGVIQSTLVLRDHPLEYMELDDWHISMNPKVWGTRNLSRAFSSPQETDFFMMLSSVCNF